MSTESLPLQHDMFTGEFVDARSQHSKRQDRERQRPQQTPMFPIREMVQMGVSARPWLKALPAPPLELTCQDVRTPEEIERDLLREAEQHTVPLFAGESVPLLQTDERKSASLPQVVCSAGYRLRARRAGVALRRRGE